MKKWIEILFFPIQLFMGFCTIAMITVFIPSLIWTGLIGMILYLFIGFDFELCMFIYTFFIVMYAMHEVIKSREV